MRLFPSSSVRSKANQWPRLPRPFTQCVAHRSPHLCLYLSCSALHTLSSSSNVNLLLSLAFVITVVATSVAAQLSLPRRCSPFCPPPLLRSSSSSRLRRSRHASPSPSPSPSKTTNDEHSTIGFWFADLGCWRVGGVLVQCVEGYVICLHLCLCISFTWLFSLSYAL